MSRLDTANHSYSAFSNASTTLHLVRHNVIESVWQSCETVRQSLKDSGIDAETADTAKRLFFRLRRVLTSTPLSFDSRDLPISEIANELTNLQNNPNYASIQSEIERAIENCKRLRTEPRNPISEALLEILDDSSTVVVMDSSLVPAVHSWIQDSSEYSNVSVVTRSGVQNPTSFRKNIFLASPFYAAYRVFSEPDWRFLRDPRATDLHFVMYPFGDSNVKVFGLAEKERLMRSVASQSQFLAVDNQADDIDVSEWAVIENRVSSVQLPNEDEAISARFVGLAGDNFIYLEDYPNARVLAVLRGHDNSLDVGRIALRDLSEGDSILVRIEGASADLIQAYADGLGAGTLRSHQNSWKEALRHGIAHHGGLHNFEKLIGERLQVNSSNIRNWAYNPRLIAPLARSDFDSLCDLLELPGMKNSWDHLDKIRKLHQDAGRDIVRLLRDRVKHIPADDANFLKNGFIEVRDESLGAVGVYKVQHVGQPQPVDPWRIGRLSSQI